MKKLTIIIACLISCLFLCACGSGSGSFGSSRSGVKNNLKRFDKHLTGMGNIRYNFYELPSEVVNFIKSESEIKKLYDEYDGKKIVMYMYGTNCPYGNTFLNAVKKFTKDAYYTDNFKFFGRDVSQGIHFEVSWPSDASKEVIEKAKARQEAFSDYMSACGTFSIFNPAKNQVFTIDAVGYEEAAKVQTMLDALMDW